MPRRSARAMRAAPRLRAAAAAAVAIPLALAACQKKPPPPPGPPTVGYVVLKAQAVTLTTELPGRTTSFAMSDVRPQVNGVIQSRLFTEGSDVRQGQPLYQIDPKPYQAALAQAQGQLAGAQANAVTARLKAQRYDDLVKINAVSKQDADDARAANGQAAASVQQGQASVQTARVNLEYTHVRAPISGRIGRTLATPGALVTADQTNALTTIQGLDPIYVDIVRSSDDLLRLKAELAKGTLDAGTARVRLVLSDGSTYAQEGTLRLSEVQVDQTTGSVTLRALFPNPNRTLLPGMYVRAEVVEGIDPNGLLAPQQGISHDPKGQASAMVVDANGKAQARIVTTDRAIGDKWLVTGGLQPGDKLITEGLMNVRQPGMAVHAVPAGSAAPSSGGGSGNGSGGGQAVQQSGSGSASAGPSSQGASR